MHNQREALSRQLAQVLSYEENDPSMPLDAAGLIDMEKLGNDPVAVSYLTAATNIHSKAKNYYHDADYENEPLAMKQLFFVLPDNIVGTNRAFNDGTRIVNCV